MTPQTEDRFWIDNGVVHAQVKAGGFVPLELVLDGTVIARPVPRPVETMPGYVEIEHPLPVEVVSSGVSVIFLRKQGEETPLAALPVILMGWRPRWLAKAGLHQLEADALAIDVAEPVILDGEAFPPGRYRVAQGPELTFISA